MKTKHLIIFCIIVLIAQALAIPEACKRQPTISGLCDPRTLDIHYDFETQRCKYMGCSSKQKTFKTLEDCERICNRRKKKWIHYFNSV